MVAKEQQVGAHVAPGDGEDQGTASKDSAFKMPAMSNNGKSSPAPRSPAPCKQTGSSPIKKSKASASSSESDKKSSKKSASTDEFEEESDDDLFARVSSVQKMPSKSAAPAADADATMTTPSKRVTPSSSAAKDKSSTKKAIPSAKKAIPSALKVRSASAKKGKTSKEEKDQENQDGDDVLMTGKTQSKKRKAPAAELVRIVAAAESVRMVAAHPTFQNGPVAGGGIIKPSQRPRPPLI